MKNAIKTILRICRNISYLGRFHVQQFLVQKRIVKADTQYTKFVILGRSRTGSNFLRGLLNAHPDVIAFGEIFGNTDLVGWNVSGYPESKSLLVLLCARPIEFLEKYVYGNFPSHMQAVGIKIFYYHARKEPWSCVWEYLKEHKEIKIIHLKRKNILKTMLSRKIAGMTYVWSIRSDRKARELKIELGYDECIDEFEKTRNYEEQHDDFFSDHDVLELHYEDLAEDTGGQVERVQDFLAVQRKDLRPSTRKQRRIPLSQSISNYEDLKKQFHDSPWRQFFED